MARTFSGMVFKGAGNLEFPTAQRGNGAGQYAAVRNADGTLTLNNTAGVATVNLFAPLDMIKRPFISFPAYPGQGTVPLSNELQQMFGTAAGGPGDPVGPGFNGTPAKPWGISLVDIFAVYSVATAAVTTATLALSRITFSDNVALTVTALVAATTTGKLATNASATSPYVAKLSLAQPLVYESTDNTDLAVELVITAAATSLVRVYGVGAHIAVEYS